jgi:hypothetical protein
MTPDIIVYGSPDDRTTATVLRVAQGNPTLRSIEVSADRPMRIFCAFEAGPSRPAFDRTYRFDQYPARCGTREHGHIILVYALGAPPKGGVFCTICAPKGGPADEHDHWPERPARELDPLLRAGLRELAWDYVFSYEDEPGPRGQRAFEVRCALERMEKRAQR